MQQTTLMHAHPHSNDFVDEVPLRDCWLCCSVIPTGVSEVSPKAVHMCSPVQRHIYPGGRKWLLQPVDPKDTHIGEVLCQRVIIATNSSPPLR
jgi:hypothetical protein